MEKQTHYATVTIAAGPEGFNLPDKIIGVLSRLVRRSPATVKLILQSSSLKLAKVILNSDVEKLIAVLNRSGLTVTITPVSPDEPSEPKPLGASSDKTLGKDLTFHSGRNVEDLDWKKGDVIEGLYEVHGSAKGGMGRVYFVFHRLWKMMLAIKTPLRMAASSEARVLRFLREAELWVDLGVHPNIATCYYARVIGGLPRLFIEYVDGGTLDEWYEQGRVKDLRVLVDLMLQFCHGMSYAAEKGMVHRDVKPQNCLISQTKTLKITDFGLVKRLDDAATLPRPEGSPDWSRTPDAGVSVTLLEGGITGSPWYMAPERFREGAKDDIRSDIYSFGIMLYEIGLGTMPFRFPTGFSLPTLVKAHMRSRPGDPLAVRPDLPVSLATIIMTCLEKKPENRYPSFVDLGNALEGVWRDIRPGHEPRRRPNVVGLKADSLNNQAVSLLDLGRQAEARALLEDAHSANPEHLEAVYNLYTSRWARGELSDREVLSRMDSLRIEARETPDFHHFMGLIQIQRGEAAEGIELLKRAYNEGSQYKDRWDAHGGDPQSFVDSLGLTPISELASFAGHIKAVRCVAFSPSSPRAFSVGEDRSIRIWDTTTGRCLKNLRTFTFVPVAGTFSADGRLAATVYGDAFKTIDLWDTIEGKLIRRFQGMGGYGVAFSHDTKYLAAFGSDGRIRVLETSSEKIAWELKGVTAKMSGVAFMLDGQSLAVGGEDGSLSVIQLASRKLLLRVPAHDGAVSCIHVSPRFNTVLTGGTDNLVRLWDVSSGMEVKRYSGHRGTVAGVGLMPDGKYVLSASADGTVRIWDRSSGRCHRTIAVSGEELTSYAVSSDGSRLLTGSAQGSVRLWSVDTGWFGKDFLEPAICRPRTFEDLVRLHTSFSRAVEDFNRAWKKGDTTEGLAILERVRNVPGFCWSREAILIRNVLEASAQRGALRSHSFIRAFHGHRSAVLSVQGSSDSLMLLSGSLDGTAAIWNVVSGRCTRRIDVGSPVTHAFFLPKMQGIVTWSRDSVLRTWGLDGKLGRVFHDVEAPVLLTDDGHKLAALSQANQPLILDLKTGGTAPSGAVIPGTDFMCFSKGMETIYSLRDGTRITRWDTATGRNQGAFRDLGLKITALSPTAADDKVVAGMETGLILIYLVGSRVNIANLRGHTAAIRTMAPDPTEKLWITGADDRTLRLWDIGSQTCAAMLAGHSCPVTSVCFFPNMALIASGDSKGSVRLWGLEWEMTAR